MAEFINKLTFALRSLGFWAVLRTIPGTLRRDAYDRQVKLPPSTSHAQAPGNLQQVDMSANGACLQFQNYQLQVKFLAHDLVRLSWLPGKPPIPYALAAVDWPEVSVQRQIFSDHQAFSTPELVVRVYLDGRVVFETVQGNLLRSDQPPCFAGQAGTGGVTLVSQLQAGERIHGLGERAAPFNLRPGSYRFQNMEAEGSYADGDDPLYMGIPVYLGRHAAGSYLVFYENSHYGRLELDTEARLSFDDGQLRYYFIHGSLERIYARYSQLTGRPPLPPRWALGYHQSRWGYKTEAQVREVVAGFRQHRLPWSALHLDIDYMDGYRCFTVNRTRFPDLPGLVADLERDGLKVVAINDVGLKRAAHYSQYQQALEQDLCVKAPDGSPLHALVWPGWCAFPDFTNPAARTWWGKQYAWFVENGFAGVWHDMNEPAAFVAWGEPRLPLGSQYFMEGRGGDHREANNLYGLLNNRAGFEGLRQLRPDKRPWLVSRSGWAGLQRYAWHWTADILTSWQSLRLTIAQVLNLSLSGIPYTGPDIGGFTGSPGAELFTRWFQLAACLPFFRGHAAVGTERQEPWVYGEPYTSVIRRYLELRYQLMPYWYTLAWQAAQDGVPLVRPLFWHFPQDLRAGQCDDQYLLGDSLLVAPVLAAQSAWRDVWLPAGRWYSWWQPQSWYEGPGQVRLPVSLAEMPLLVRGASILPVEAPDGPALHIYLPAEAASFSAQRYDDAGDGYGDWRLESYQAHWQAGVLQIDRRVEGNLQTPRQAVRIYCWGAQFEYALVDGEQQTMLTNSFLVSDFQRLEFHGC